MSRIPPFRSSLCASLLGFALAAGAVSADPVGPPGPGASTSATVPFSTATIGEATRPIIEVQLNGHPSKMMVHANASLYVQVIHRIASQVGVRDLRHQGAFGIEAPGKVSTLGRDEGVLDRLTIGGATVTNVPVSVFETPEPDADVGMLGIGWLRANGVVLDYPGKHILVSPDAAQTSNLRTRLLGVGYVALPMQFDEKANRYVVRATLGRVERAMVVSTVGNVVIDEAFAHQAGVKKGAVDGEMYGPKGAKLHRYRTKQPVVVGIGTWSSRPVNDAAIEDVYAYASQARPDGEANGGMLGADFLTKAGAVIDFGGKTLYLRR
ncbi:hypothetical protein [Xanthomonas sp. NCPPB 1128]|uniref:hypothetical protein n=1 Tax=Xanthomonas sp. NCPPB 1128 TaxID=1775876 RepID=UPI000A864DC2|nr:hypothetical protein [Xanthomonas sp. NCPPB 1128]